MHKSLSQSRKKVAKLGQEMNDLKLLLEAQQGRNAELEKRQRKWALKILLQLSKINKTTYIYIHVWYTHFVAAIISVLSSTLQLHRRACRFDADLNAAKDESSSEVQAKEKLAREKEHLQIEFTELKDKIKVRKSCKCTCTYVHRCMYYHHSCVPRI